MTARFGGGRVHLDRQGETSGDGTHQAGGGVGCGLAALLDNAPLLILTTDADLRFTWAAGRVPAWPGTDGTVVGRTAWEVCGTGDAGRAWIAPLRRALRGERTRGRIECDDTRLDYRVGPLPGMDRRPVGTVAVVLDVTDAERADQRQRAAEERFRRLAEHSPAIVDLRDGEDRIVHANPAFLRAFGVRLAQVIGWRPAERLDLDQVEGSDITDLVNAGEQVRASSQPRVWQGRVPHSDGHLLDLVGHIFPLPAADGAAGIGEVFLDVTAHERTRRELADAEQRFRAFFNAAEIGVMTLDLQGTVLDVNPAALRLLGYHLHQVRGRSMASALGAADIERHAPLWAELVAGRRNRYDLTVTVRSSDGSQRPAQLTAALVRTRDGDPSTVLALAVPLAPDTTTAAPPPTRSLPSAGEAAVLERLATGASLQQIATDLGMSRRGVDYRITRLRHKLRADGPGGAPATSAALIARAYALGILHPAVWPPKVVDHQQADDRPDVTG